MCLLIVLRGFHEEFPVIVAANRDEHRARKASPPGLFVGERHRILSPRDREAGGTWLAVADDGRFAGVTNIAGAPFTTGRSTRGELPHLALDAGGVDAGVEAVCRRVQEQEYNAFQLVLADARRIVVLRHTGGGPQVVEWTEPVLSVSNEHKPGTLILEGLAKALGPVKDVDHRLDLLRPLLLDRGGMGRHPVLKRGGDHGTVSSSLIAVPRTDPRTLRWRYAPGPPDETGYRNYGNLGKRLVAGGGG